MSDHTSSNSKQPAANKRAHQKYRALRTSGQRRKKAL
jgi:hypothetical protein